MVRRPIGAGTSERTLSEEKAPAEKAQPDNGPAENGPAEKAPADKPADHKPPVDDLFGEEDLGGLARDPGPLPEAPPRRPPMKLIAGLAGALLIVGAWWLSSRNSERFFIVVDGDMVRVEKGYFLPFGSGPHAPTPAYDAFRLPPGVRPDKSGAMTVEKVDKVLYALFFRIADREIADLEAGDMEVAEEMLMRAQKLQTTSITDDRILLEKLGDVSFRRGITQVQGIQQRFDAAIRQFELASRRGGATFTGAEKWVESIKRLREEFRRLSAESGLDPDLLLGGAHPPAEAKAEPAPAKPAAPAPDAGP